MELKNLPDDIVELLDSYDDNCMLVEQAASEMITSIKIPMFGALRDLRPSSLYLGLHRLQQWFGKKRNMDHCLCLIMLTDYVSCAYNSRNFYGTFHSALTRQFIDGIFVKLFIEWQMMLESKKFSELPSSKTQIVHKFLTVTCKCYSDTFRHINSLRNLANMNPKYITSAEAEHYITSNCELMLIENDYSSLDIENDDPKIDASQFYIRPKILTEKNTYQEQNAILEQPTVEKVADSKIVASKIPKSDTKSTYRKQNAILEQPIVEKRKVTDSKMVATKIPKLDAKSTYQEQNAVLDQPIVGKRKVIGREVVPAKIPKLDASFERTKKLLTQRKLPQPSVNNSMPDQTVISKLCDVRKCGFAELETSSFESPKIDAKSVSLRKDLMQENLPAPRSLVDNPISKQMKIREPLRMQNNIKIVETIKIDDDTLPFRMQNTAKIIETITIDDDTPKKGNSYKKKLNAFDILMRRPARLLNEKVCY